MEASSQTCLIHRDRVAVQRIGTCGYCASCRDEIEAAVRALPTSVAARDCLAMPVPGSGWQAWFAGAAAHWLAHELGARPPPGRGGCAAGFALRRADLLVGRREVVRELPWPRDLWIDLDEEGCGLVVAVRRGESGGVEISIRGPVGHGGAVSGLDFYRDLSGRGRFFR